MASRPDPLRRHPNDLEETIRRLRVSALTLTKAERQELLAMIDAALAKLRRPFRSP